MQFDLSFLKNAAERKQLALGVPENCGWTGAVCRVDTQDRELIAGEVLAREFAEGNCAERQGA